MANTSTPPLCIWVCHPQRPQSADPLLADLSATPRSLLQSASAGSRQCSRRWKLQLFVNVAPMSKCQAQGHSLCSWAVSSGDRPYGRSRSMLSATSQTAWDQQSRSFCSRSLSLFIYPSQLFFHLVSQCYFSPNNPLSVSCQSLLLYHLHSLHFLYKSFGPFPFLMNLIFIFHIQMIHLYHSSCQNEKDSFTGTTEIIFLYS